MYFVIVFTIANVKVRSTLYSSDFVHLIVFCYTSLVEERQAAIANEAWNKMSAHDCFHVLVMFYQTV